MATTASTPLSTNQSRPKSWATGLTPETVQKQQAFYETRVKHPNIDRLLDNLMPQLTPSTESNIVVVTGATGAGKTTLTRNLLKSLFQDFESLMNDKQGAIPLISVEAYADGSSNPGFKEIYESMLEQLKEPGTDMKVPAKVSDGKLSMQPFARGSVPSLRKVVEQALKERGTRVVVIDEAAHFLRFHKEANVMQTLRSLSNTTNVKWVLVGAFDLADLILQGGEISRRSGIHCLERYRFDRKEDRVAFETVVQKLQDKWPCEQVPNFAAISDALLEMSLGCVGLLKTFLLDASALQLRNDGKWDPAFLQKAVKSNGLREVIRLEIEAGEKKVQDVLYGNSTWDDDTLAKLVHRMETSRA